MTNMIEPTELPDMVYSQRHGGPYDRGSADSYYGRNYSPHYYVGNTYSSPIVEECDMTPEEIAAYRQGYLDNEEEGYSKEW